MKNLWNLVTLTWDRILRMTLKQRANLDWFYHLTGGVTHTDFFATRPTDYSQSWMKGKTLKTFGNIG